MGGAVKEFFKDLLGLFSFKPRRFLCDTCEYDYARACSRPEYPNAVECPEYRRRKGSK